MHHNELLPAIAISVLAATAMGLLAHLARLPLLIAYILAGVVIGPKIGFGWVRSEAEIQSISEIGLILLLFIIGLEIDLKKLIKAGKAVTITGLLQAPLSFAIAWGMLALMGFANRDGQYELLYLAFSLAISSTMIVVKALYEKHELDTLAGRITLGVLVFQDIWAIVFLALQPNLTNPELWSLLDSFAKGAGLILFCLLLSRYVLPRLFDTIAKLPEFMLVVSLAWCFLVASLATLAGLSKEMGALIAGLSLSTFPYNLDVAAKVINIRDFFIMLFLVALGMQIPMPTAEVVGVAIVLSALVFLTRVLTVWPILVWLRQGRRVGVVSAINLSQISEFALVAGAVGLGYQHIKAETISYIVFTLVFTAVLSTYLIAASYDIFLWLNRALGAIGLVERIGEEEQIAQTRKTVFILGFFKFASSLLYEIEAQQHFLKSQIRIIDFNPAVIQALREKGYDAQYGDIAHLETLHHLGIEQAEVVVCTIPDALLKGTTNLNLLKAIQQHAPAAKTIVISEDIGYAVQLYEAGADYVLVPRLRVAQQLLEILEKSFNWTKPGTETISYKELQVRKEVLS